MPSAPEPQVVSVRKVGTASLGLANLSPVEQLRAPKLVRRLTQLMIGLMLFGFSMSLMIVAGLGQLPWDVLHVGLATHIPFSIGQTIILVSGLVLLLWIPLRQMPGLGTIANAIVVGLATDWSLSFLPIPEDMATRIALMLFGILLNAFCTALYIGSQLGPGPRDGLMTGFARKFGLSIRLVRTLIEVVVVVIGVLLGGVFGVGTILFALTIGPLTQAMLPYVVVRLPDPIPGVE